MRVWNVPPSRMCARHLIREHVDVHGFVNLIKRKESPQEYIDSGMVEIHNLRLRHDELADEMKLRSLYHDDYSTDALFKVKLWEAGHIDADRNIRTLSEQCPDCELLLRGTLDGKGAPGRPRTRPKTQAKRIHESRLGGYF